MKYAKKFIQDYNLKHFTNVWHYRIFNKAQSFPTIFQIQTTNTCNSHCQMCPNSRNNNRPTEVMDSSLFKRIILEVEQEAKKQTMILLYLQNEPLTDPRLWEKVRLVKDHDKGILSVGILTNGILLNKNILERVIDSRIDFISISLDAYSRQTYEKIRRGLDFNTVLQNINDLLISDFDRNHLAVEFVLQELNVGEFKSFKEYWSGRVGAIMVNHLTNRSGDLPDYADLSTNQDRFGLWDRFQYGLVRRLVSFCPKPFFAFHVASNGDVVVCTEDYSKKMVLGNLNTTTIKKIWNGEGYTKLRKQIAGKQYKDIELCKDCSLWNQGILHWF